MWAWSTVTSGTFSDWYESRPELVEVGLGDPVPENLREKCEAAGIPAEDLRAILTATTEVIYTNLFGAITWGWVTTELDSVADVLARYEMGLPHPGCLPVSSDREREGWGNPLDYVSVQAIRAMDWTAGC